ncbi:MAG: alanine--tRNA ligase [Spirochaetes bacterium]|nr:alanine--tRNA ligase [Spirochaetota bacterium]
MKKVHDLRTSFIDFFKEREHRIVPSSSLIPKDDPTLLFTTAGMVQFKPMFAGTVELEYTRAASIQKCLRTSDLEKVGKTKRHCTFFEMLGNFSFGDYFKKEAIQWAWEYSTEVIGFPKEDIWVSIYLEDDEAFDIWHKTIGLPKEKIIRLGKEDNFWGPAGDSGACGPCSELYLDRGPSFGCGKPDCKPGCDCERFLEFWNLVFNQYFQDTQGVLHPLPRTGIDTGMGLERLATLVQNVDSIYQTDELKGLVDYIVKVRNIDYQGASQIAVNVLVEHARALTFAISDGAYPSNEGRGYVLRRILRRALRYGRQIGIHEPFVYTIVDPLVAAMGRQYPELSDTKENVKAVIKGEEERFLETIENGMDRLEEIIKTLVKKGEKVISGNDVFVLYDTYGFPVEMTEEIAVENGLRIDREGFEHKMEEQRTRGRQSWKGTDGKIDGVVSEILKRVQSTEFEGYEKYDLESEIVVLSNFEGLKAHLSEGENGIIVVGRTPFYGESGGQVGDTGYIESDNARFKVVDTKKSGDLIVHIGQLEKGSLHEGQRVRLSIDGIRRNLTRANHTATHLLQAALRTVLGQHVKQAGSLVAPDHFRFDFTHFKAMTPEELNHVEAIVNEKVWAALPVNTAIVPLQEALQQGAMAVFDEKYSDIVRMVSISDFSKELCGGTHVDNTGKIGVFRIMRESSPGAGVRRIEGVTLKGVYQRLVQDHTVVRRIMSLLEVNESNVEKKIAEMIEKISFLEKELEKTKAQGLKDVAKELYSKAENINSVKFVRARLQDMDADALRTLADYVRELSDNVVVCLASSQENKAFIIAAATKGAIDKGIDCGAIIKTVAKEIGGGGGGRKDLAQAGGKDIQNIGKALDKCREIVLNSSK